MTMLPPRRVDVRAQSERRHPLRTESLAKTAPADVTRSRSKSRPSVRASQRSYPPIRRGRRRGRQAAGARRGGIQGPRNARSASASLNGNLRLVISSVERPGLDLKQVQPAAVKKLMKWMAVMIFLGPDRRSRFSSSVPLQALVATPPSSQLRCRISDNLAYGRIPVGRELCASVGVNLHAHLDFAYLGLCPFRCFSWFDPRRSTNGFLDIVAANVNLAYDREATPS